MTKWKDIPGYKNRYQINNNGDVQSLRCKWGERNPPKILTPYIDPIGYVRIGLSINSKTKTYCLHRLIANAFIPNPLNKKEVNHIDGNKQNNELSNLEWVTRAENAAHAVKNKLCAWGMSNHRSKLTDKDVLIIRMIFIPKKGGNRSRLAKQYNVSVRTINSVVHKESWQHLDD